MGWFPVVTEAAITAQRRGNPDPSAYVVHAACDAGDRTACGREYAEAEWDSARPVTCRQCLTRIER